MLRSQSALRALLLLALTVSACAATVQSGQSSDGGVESGVAPDRVQPVDVPRDVPEISDVATSDVVDAQVVPDGAIFDDVQLQGSECNDLFPSPPIMPVYRDEEYPVESIGGPVRDGLYTLVRVDQYLQPRPSAVRTYLGMTLRVRAAVWDYAVLASVDADWRRGTIVRQSGRFVGEQFAPARRVCPDFLAGQPMFIGHEVRGNQLVVLQRPYWFTLERVGDP